MMSMTALALAVGLASVARAPPALAADSVAEGKRHFLNGVRLFEDRNLAGALVEFEASFADNPTAAALQNIAVCQKGLFRYADAIATLERMLKRFGAELSAEDKKAADEAIRDMSALLGTLVLQVSPKDAKITINGAPLDAAALAAPVRLAAGEYRVAAEAPGYQAEERIVTVVSQKQAPLEIALRPVKNESPARDQAAAPINPPADTAPGDRGLYALLSLGGALFGGDPPPGLVREKPRSGGGFAVVRGGYRFSSLFGLELDISASNDSVGACRDTPECPTQQGAFRLSTTRIGPAARFMTSGAKGRLVGTVGFGPAVHSMSYDNVLLGPNGAPSNTSGVGSYFELAGSYELNLGHLLLGAGLRLLSENADKVGMKNVNSLGLDLQIGYSQW
jgi:hypothetical protein